MTQKENVANIVNHWQSSVTESAEITPEQWASLDSMIADQVAAKAYPLAGVPLAESLAEVAEKWQSPTEPEAVPIVGKPLRTWPNMNRKQNHQLRKLRSRLKRFQGETIAISAKFSGDPAKRTRMGEAYDNLMMDILKIFADSLDK